MAEMIAYCEQDVRAMRAGIAKVKSATHSALCYGLSDQVVAELRGRGF